MLDVFISIEEAIACLQAGRMIILMDDENRENEGDLVIAAEHATPEAINFMAMFGRGLICLPMATELVDKLRLPMMTRTNRSPYGTAFTVSIEAAHGVSTGISAQDRARTIQVAIDSESGPEHIISPGHVFPLRAVPGGVLIRPGQTEGSVDLARLAGLRPAAVICEVMNEDGTMSRALELQQFSKTHNIPLVRIKDLIDYRIQHEDLVEEVVTTKLPLDLHGEFLMTVFSNAFDASEHFALLKKRDSQDNDPEVASTNAAQRFLDKCLPKQEQMIEEEAPLVRIHSECLTGDALGSSKCDCGPQLQASLKQISAEGGVLVYLRQEGRGIGLANKLKAYVLQEQGYDTVEANLKLGFPADSRSYGIAYQILKHLGLKKVRLLTNNPEKVAALEHYGITVEKRIPLVVSPTHENRGYLKTKQAKLGHLLESLDDE